MKIENFATIRLPNFSARVMRSALSEIGADWHCWADDVGLDRAIIDDASRRVTGAQELDLQEAFVRASEHAPGLWFRVGLQYRLIGYGPLGLAVLAADTFGAGLQVLASYRALTFSLLDFPMISAEGEQVSIVADDCHIGQRYREFCQERGLGAAVRILTDMDPRLSPIVRIETTLSGRGSRQDWSAQLGIPIVFDAPTTRIVLREGVADAPLPMADDLIGHTFSMACDKAINEAETADGTTGRLYRVLIRATAPFPDVSGASLMLGVSERTLHRRLAEQGLTFGDMLDRVRRQRANSLLRNTDLPVEQIAASLGFSEPASFSRAYKRWTGHRPASARQARGERH